MRAALICLTTLFIAPLFAEAYQDVKVRLRVQRELKALDLSGVDIQISGAEGVLPIQAPRNGLNRVRISRNDKGEWAVKWKNSDAPKAKLKSKTLKVSGQFLRVGPESLPHEVRVFSGKAGLDVVTELDLETYLAGVVPSEMPASWPLEALKAQAIAARSFALRQRQERQSWHFDLDSTVMDQMFKFLHEAEENPRVKSRINEVLVATRGQTLEGPRGRVLKAFYSADCGCQSEDPKFVWGTIEAFQSVKDPTCTRRKPTLWDLTLERKDVRQRLLAELSLPQHSNLKAMHVSSRTPSGRVKEVIAAFDIEGKLHKATLPAQQFRKVFGFAKVRSADFSLKWFADQLHINGTGLGHGVGLCQMGARALADEGMDYRAILKLYYPKAKLRTRRAV